MVNPTRVVDLESRRYARALGQIADVLKDLSLVDDAAPSLVATPKPIAVSMDQAAQLLSITRPTIEEEMRKGVLRTLRIGQRRLVRLDSLNAYAQAQEEAEAKRQAAERERRVE